MPKIGANNKAESNGRPTCASEAQRLCARGFSVVPCDGKKATIKGWPEKRLTRKELREAFEGNRLNIAIALNQSDLIDVECDSGEAEANLQRLFGGKIPPTPTWKSKRGYHRLFKRPAGLPEKAKIELDEIEFRIGNGKGALSIFPPSVHPDGDLYEWVDGLSIYDVEPAELLVEIVERLKAPAPTTITEPNSDGTIPEGKRNDELFKKGCALKEMDLPEETIATVLLGLNERLCKPPLPEQEVRAIAHSVATGETKPKIGFLNRLLKDIELWHDQNENPHTTMPQGDHNENWVIGKRSKQFRRWLSKLYYDATGSMLVSNDLSEIAMMLEGKAVFDGPQYQVFRRVANFEEKIYVDLCNSKWQAVEIDAEGWRIVSDPPVKFRRAKAMHPLPIPVETPGRELKKLLRPFLNIQETQWPLIAGWLVASLRPIGPYPVCKLLGEQGGGKTTQARVMRAIIDPNAAPVRAEPRSTRDLMIAANNGWVICLDNLSVVKPELSDALCRLSTGGGFATRTLYSDEDETIFDATRPVILTSIEEIGTRSDLLERSLIIELPSIKEDARKPEKTFWRDFEKVKPQILGALLDVVSGAIRRLPEIERKANADLPRLADFHMWGEAAEESLGLEPGTFAESYSANREQATFVALESSPLVTALLKHLKKHPNIEETATRLLEILGWGNCELLRAPGWPKTPRVLSAILKRVAPNLRQIGIVAVQDTRGGGDTKEKVWRITSRSHSAPAKSVFKKKKTVKKKKKVGRKIRKGRK